MCCRRVLPVIACCSPTARSPVVTCVAAGGSLLVALALVACTGFTVAAPVVYLAGFTALLWFVLGFTVIGRRLYAVGGNPEAARLSGINVQDRKSTRLNSSH